MSIRFHGSPRPTLGIEVEVQVIDPRTRALAPGAPVILEKLDDPRHFKPEFITSNLELNTDICETIEDARENLQGLIDRLLAAADESGYAIACAGTHPFSLWRDQEVTPAERYQHLAERHQWSSRRLVIFGIHYHVGIEDGEKAIAILNALMAYIAHLLALSSSSPFWHGVDTGLYSVRAKIFEGLPTAGLPYILMNWGEFVWFMKTLIRAEAIESIREVWWDIRPHHRYGTLEVRVCDGMTNLNDIILLAAFVQALIVQMSRDYDEGRRLKYLPRWIIQENKWRAARYGPAAKLIKDRSGELIPLRDSFHHMLEKLEPVARDLGSVHLWPALYEMVERPTAADRMRAWYAESGDFRVVVDRLIHEFRSNQIFHCE